MLLTGLTFMPKQGSDPMELADLLARDMYEWLRDGCETWPGRWRMLSSKIYCRGDCRQGKFGFKVFPDSDQGRRGGAPRGVVRGLERSAPRRERRR
jgi:hypothetical protein